MKIVKRPQYCRFRFPSLIPCSLILHGIQGFPNFNSFFFLQWVTKHPIYTCVTPIMYVQWKNSGERINFKNFVTFLCMFENYYNLFEFGTGFGECIFPFHFMLFFSLARFNLLILVLIFNVPSRFSLSLSCSVRLPFSLFIRMFVPANVYSLQYPV